MLYDYIKETASVHRSDNQEIIPVNSENFVSKIKKKPPYGVVTLWL